MISITLPDCPTAGLDNVKVKFPDGVHIHWLLTCKSKFPSLSVVTVPVALPTTFTSSLTVRIVVPVAIESTSASASFLMVTSLVEPCPVRIKPSPAVYPIAALSPADVSPVASTVPPVITPVVVMA